MASEDSRAQSTVHIINNEPVYRWYLSMQHIGVA